MVLVSLQSNNFFQWTNHFNRQLRCLNNLENMERMNLFIRWLLLGLKVFTKLTKNIFAFLKSKNIQLHLMLKTL